MAVTLKAEKRELNVSSNRLRKENLIPGTVYGPTSTPLNVSVNLADLKDAYIQVRETMILELDVQGEKSNVIIRDLQKDPVNDHVLSVSFMKVNMDQIIGVAVPVTFTGVSMAVKNNLGFLVTPVSEISVRCLPKDIPSKYDVDISVLENVGDSILLKDIDLGQGVNLAPGLDLYIVIATIVPPQKEVRTEVVEVAGDANATPETQESKPEESAS